MSARLLNLTTKLIAALTVTMFGVVVGQIETQAQSGDIRRAADAKPDLSGIWQAVGAAHWDIEPHAA